MTMYFHGHCIRSNDPRLGSARTPAMWGANGWYLLVPPRSYVRDTPTRYHVNILNDKPLSQWPQMAAYDSASECEAARIDRLQKAQSAFDSAKKSGRDAILIGPDIAVSIETLKADVSAYIASRCVRSDNPGLGETQ